MRALIMSMVPLSIRRQTVIGLRCRLAGANVIFCLFDKNKNCNWMTGVKQVGYITHSGDRTSYYHWVELHYDSSSIIWSQPRWNKDKSESIAKELTKKIIQDYSSKRAPLNWTENNRQCVKPLWSSQGWCEAGLGHKDRKDWTTRFALTQGRWISDRQARQARGCKDTRPSAGGTMTHVMKQTACQAPWLVCCVQEETDEESIARTTRKREKHQKVGR